MIITKRFLLALATLSISLALPHTTKAYETLPYYVKGFMNGSIVTGNKFKDAKTDATPVTKINDTTARDGALTCSVYKQNYEFGLLGGAAVGFETENGLSFEIEGISSGTITPQTKTANMMYYL